MTHRVLSSLAPLLLLVGCSLGGVRNGGDATGVRPLPENPHYLAWDGVPIFPLGAAGSHSWTPISRPGTMDFEAQLDRLAAVIDEIGSPHVRGFVRALPYDPMNHMHDGPVERVLQPWARLADGRYDLERFDPEWEERLRAYLDAALERRIVVALEIWDDWSVTRGPGGQYDPGDGAAWNAHPFNPKNNVNYGEELLPATTAVCNAPFYMTIPARSHVAAVLRLQKLYVNRVLEIASGYPNLILNLNNESRAHRDWGRFWADYVRERVPQGVLIGDMPSTNRRDGGGECDPELSPLPLATDRAFGYVDVSQAVSRHEFPEVAEQALGGGRRIESLRRAMAEAGTRRPLVTSKDYSRGPGEGDVVLWSRFVGGAAGARFHRPGVENAADVVAFQHDAVRRLGRFVAGVPFWRMHPAPALVRSLPAGSGANVLAEPGGEVVIQLLGGAEGETIRLDLLPGSWTARWLDPSRGEELAITEIVVRAAPADLPLPARPEHRVLHLRRRP